MINIKAKRLHFDAILKSGELYLYGDEDYVLPPGSTYLLQTGIVLQIPTEYKLDIELTEDLNDSDVILIGKTTAPEKQGGEFGLIVANLGRKQVRIDTGTLIARYGLLKYTDCKVKDPDDAE